MNAVEALLRSRALHADKLLKRRGWDRFSRCCEG
jgi:hypothetical protein